VDCVDLNYRANQPACGFGDDAAFYLEALPKQQLLGFLVAPPPPPPPPPPAPPQIEHVKRISEIVNGELRTPIENALRDAKHFGRRNLGRRGGGTDKPPMTPPAVPPATPPTDSAYNTALGGGASSSLIILMTCGILLGVRSSPFTISLMRLTCSIWGGAGGGGGGGGGGATRKPRSCCLGSASR